MPRISARRKAIERRIIDAVKRAVALGYEPKSVYLDVRDMLAFAATHPKVTLPAKIDGMPVRLGKRRSTLYCRFGVSTTI